MRIAFVIPTLDQSGAERQLTLLASGLHERGHEVSVLVLNRGGYYAEVLREKAITVDVLHKRFRADPITLIRLRRHLRNPVPDIVHSFLFSANSYVRLPGVVPAGTRIVVAERCVDTWKSGWQQWVDRKLSDRMDAMTANSQAVADHYLAAGVSVSRIHVLPNGVPTASAVANQSSLREELQLPEQTRIIGFVGRLAPQKCLEDVIWAYHLLHQSVDHTALVIVGDGPDRDSLAEFAASVGCRDHVYFTGHRTDASQLTAQFDVFVLGSAFEGMSNSLMDAMAAGVPCVVSDIAANTELIEHNQNGLVFPRGDALQCAQAMRQLLTDSQKAAELAERAQRKIVQQHSVDQLIENHVRLYTQLCQSTEKNSEEAAA